MTKSTAVQLPSKLCIHDMPGLKTQLVEAISGCQNVIVVIPAEATADLSFVQLIESARLMAANAGKTLTLSWPVGEGIRAILQRGGFLAEASNDDKSFWFHREAQP